MKIGNSHNTNSQADWIVRLFFSIAILFFAGVIFHLFKSNRGQDLTISQPAPQFHVSQRNSEESQKLVSSSSSESNQSQEFLPTFENLSPQLQAETRIHEVVQQAQKELRSLGSVHPELSVKERQLFIERLQAFEDPAERQHFLQEHRESRMVKRKEDPDHERRERLQKIMRIQSLHRSAQQMGWAGETREQAEQFERQLTDFAALALTADDTEFQQAWILIEGAHYQLRQQATELRRGLATR